MGLIGEFGRSGDFQPLTRDNLHSRKTSKTDASECFWRKCACFGGSAAGHGNLHPQRWYAEQPQNPGGYMKCQPARANPWNVQQRQTVALTERGRCTGGMWWRLHGNRYDAAMKCNRGDLDSRDRPREACAAICPSESNKRAGLGQSRQSVRACMTASQWHKR